MPSTITDRLYGLSTSTAVKSPCRVATTANITMSGLQTIDGLALAALDRVLVKNQTDATENGIWIVQSGAWTRAADFDGSFDAVNGTLIYITSGTTQGGQSWRVNSTGVLYPGVDSIVFAVTTIGGQGPTGPSGSGTATVLTRTALAAIAAPANNESRLLTEDGRSGLFKFSTANLSTFVTADTAQGIYVAPASATTGASGAWIRQFDWAVLPEWWGMVANSAGAAVANVTAWSAMLTTLRKLAYEPFTNYTGLRPVRFAPAAYYFNAALDLNLGAVDICGAGMRATDFIFSDNTSALRVQYYNTSGTSSGAVTAHEHSANSTVRNLSIKGPYVDNFAVATEGEYHGVTLRAPAFFENVAVNGFKGDAWHVIAGVGSGTDLGNANLFTLTNCHGRFCRHGIQFGGSDSNAYKIIGGSFDNNRAWGHYEPDNASLGGTIIGGHYDSNGITTVAPWSVVTNSSKWYCVIDGQAAGASTNAPSGTTADNTWWAYISAGSVTSDRPAWFNGISVRSGGSVLSKSVNSVSLFIGCYGEGGYGLPQLNYGNWILGGGLANFRVVGGSGSTLSYINGFLISTGGIVAQAGITVNTSMTFTAATPFFYMNGTVSTPALVFQFAGSTLSTIEQAGSSNYYTVTAAADHIFRYSGGTESGRFNTFGLNLPTGKAYYVNSTKVLGAQGAAVADATDAASAITQLNALLARCRAHGIITT